QSAAAGQMPVGVVDVLEVVEIEKRQRKIGAVVLGAPDLLAQPIVKEAIIEQAGQLVAARQLAGSNGVERILNGRRDVSCENLHQLQVARHVGTARAPVEQLQHAADRLAHDDGHAQHGGGLVAAQRIDLGGEEGIVGCVVGDVG